MYQLGVIMFFARVTVIEVVREKILELKKLNTSGLMEFLLIVTPSPKVSSRERFGRTVRKN